MSIKLQQALVGLRPENTVLLFGAGASLPSGAPSVQTLISHFAQKFDVRGNFTLPELSSLIEGQHGRKALVRELRTFFNNLKPSGGLRNVGLYKWKSIYTTNYDDLVEQSFRIHSKKLRIYSSNFDFGISDQEYDSELFKLHGTIEKDISDGDRSRLIISDADYENTEEFRDSLYDRMKGDLSGGNLLIIGQSLADPDMKDIVHRAVTINQKAHNPAQIYLLAYEEDEQRASLFERKGLKVAFGGIDNIFAAMASNQSLSTQSQSKSDDLIDGFAGLWAVTTEIPDDVNVTSSNISSMFNGWPASVADIKAGYTFERSVGVQISQFFSEESTLCGFIIGAAGVGKTTAARQVLLKAKAAGHRAWEHNSDHTLRVSDWVDVARYLRNKSEVGYLHVDDAHSHLQQINDLVDELAVDDNAHLKILLSSQRNHWNPRIKSPNIFRYGKEFRLSKLDSDEIEKLLTLVENSHDVATLVENSFGGFSKTEKRRRLSVRCEADMFVCLKNIFASEAFDNIILREYAALDGLLQDVYRHVAAMENAGVRVHRQLIIRLLGLSSQSVSSFLDNLSEIVHEYTVDGKLGIYAWHCRHHVISAIISKYKFQDNSDIVKLFERVIDNISPAYEIEIRTLRELCNIETGLSRIPDKSIQNKLLRKMISIAPGERVPRHRLIRNLIDQNEFEKAETEIRLFGNDFGGDGPVQRYKIRLLVSRAVHTKGILDEDRIAILKQAQEQAVIGIERFPNNKSILAAYAELGVEYYRRTGDYAFYDAAIEQLKLAEERIGDPEISTIIRQFERRLAGHQIDLDSDVA